MLLDVSKVKNPGLAVYLNKLLRCSLQNGIPESYTQKAQSFGHMFDERFAESLPKRVEEGYLTIDIFDRASSFSGLLKVETFCINTHHGRVAWTAYFLDTPGSACISPFSRKENPVIDWQR